MLTTVSHVVPRARALQARQCASRVLAPCGSALLRHRQQTRGFRFGMWSSYLDPDFHREVRRRHKMMKHKYADTLARRLSWEKHPLADDARSTLKRMVHQCWTPRNGRSAGRYADAEGRPRTCTPDNKTGVRPGHSIEDVERGAVEHLFFAGRDKALYDHWISPFQSFRNYMAHQARDSAREQPDVFQSTYSSSNFNPAKVSEDYVIDPITNRKVPKHPAPTPKESVAIPVKTFKDYRSRFSQADSADDQTPIFYDGPPPPEELRKYRQVKIDHWPEDADGARIVPGAFPQPNPTGDARSAPVLESGAYVRDHNTAHTAHPAESGVTWNHNGVFWRTGKENVAEASEHAAEAGTSVPAGFPFVEAQSPAPPKINDLKEHKVVGSDDAASAEAAAPPYEDLDKYNKPIVEPSSAPENAERPYEDLDKYTPVMNNEPGAADNSGPKYEDLDKYTPVMGNEPAAADNSTPKYEDLDKYAPVMNNEPTAAEDSTPKYEDLDKYKTFMYNEPDGKPPGYTDLPETPPELHQYTPFWYNEPDGKPPGIHEAADGTAELHKYNAFRYREPDGKPMGTEEHGYDPAEIAQYQAFRYQEPDGKPEAQEQGYDRAELSRYKAFRYQEPNGKPEVAEEHGYDSAELRQYDAFRYQEPDGKPLDTKDQGYDASELGGYTSVRWNEPDGKPAGMEEDRDLGELRQYEAVRHQEPDGKPPVQSCPVADSLAEVDAEKNYDEPSRLASSTLDSADESSAEVLRKLRHLSLNATEAEKAEDLDLLRASDVRAAAGSAAKASETQPQEGKTHYRKMLESLMSNYQNTSDAVDREASSTIRSVRAKIAAEESPETKEASRRTLTGNYVRDFPEEFERSWSTVNSESQTTLFPKDKKEASANLESKIQGEEREQVEGAFASFSPRKLQPALDRQRTSQSTMTRRERWLANVDPYSKEPQGLETSYAEEVRGQRTCPPYMRTYGAISSKSSAKQNRESSEPISYKVLAYDASTQEVHIAETRSVAPDSAKAVPPAEILRTLSHPAKFLPHFAPLQAEGYEIVSGNGDVLVFRKVRDAQAAFQVADLAAPETASPAVNPIDMTGSPQPITPASANFASPTGYVNYGSTQEAAAPSASRDLPPPPAARFQSNIDVRREEPVFSGPKGDGRKKESKSAGKRLLAGAAWVAGISYALGVVGEYFKSGGVDGLGPKGL